MLVEGGYEDGDLFALVTDVRASCWDRDHGLTNSLKPFGAGTILL